MNKSYIYLFLFLLVLPLVSSQIILVKPPTGYITNSSALNVNSSEISNYANFAYAWITNEGILSNVADIQHQWLSNLAWSVAGHTIDTNVNFNSYNITSLYALLFQGGQPITWDSDARTINIPTGLGNTIQAGQELTLVPRNNEGSTIYQGQLVYQSGVSGERTLVKLADANSSNPDMMHNLGMVTIPSCNDQADCPVTYFGDVNELDTSAFTEGDNLYLSCDGSGNITTTIPTGDCYRIHIGHIKKVHASAGIINFQPEVDWSDNPAANNFEVFNNLTGKDANFSGNISTNCITLGDGQKYCTIAGDYYNRSQVDELVGSINLALYFHNATHPERPTYKLMNMTANSLPEATFSFTVTSNNFPLGNFSSNNASVMGISGLTDGIYDGHFHADATQTGAKDVFGFWELWIAYSNGTFLKVGTSELEQIISEASLDYDAHLYVGQNYPLNTSDKLEVRLYANLSGTGTDPTLNFYIDGNTASRFQFSASGLNFATKQDLESYVPYTGATSNVNLGSKNFTTTGYGFFDYIGSLTNRVKQLFFEQGNYNQSLNGMYQNLSLDGGVATMNIILGENDGTQVQLTEVEEPYNHNITGYNVTADYFLGDGSLLTNVNGDNSSWNQSLADTLYAPISVTGDVSNNTDGGYNFSMNSNYGWTTTGTITGEQITSTDDINLAGKLTNTMGSSDIVGLSIEQSGYTGGSNLAIGSITGTQSSAPNEGVKDASGLSHTISNEHIMIPGDDGIGGFNQKTSGIFNTVQAIGEHNFTGVIPIEETTTGITNNIKVAGLGGGTRTIKTNLIDMYGIGIENNVDGQKLVYNSAGGTLNYNLYGVKTDINTDDLTETAGTLTPTLYGNYITLKGSLTTTDTGYGYYFHSSSQLTNAYAFYNGDINNADNFMGGDGSKTYFGSSKDAWEVFDGTNFNFNQTGNAVWTFWNSSGLGRIRVGDIVYSTPDINSFEKSSLDTLKDPSTITKVGKDDLTYHQSFPDAVQEYIDVKDENNCWEEVVKTQYCYDYNNTEYCFDEQNSHKELKNERIVETKQEECGTKQELVISGGKGYLDNYNLIYQLKEENTRIKQCATNNLDYASYRVCVIGGIAPK